MKAPLLDDDDLDPLFPLYSIFLMRRGGEALISPVSAVRRIKEIGADDDDDDDELLLSPSSSKSRISLDTFSDELYSLL